MTSNIVLIHKNELVRIMKYKNPHLYVYYNRLTHYIKPCKQFKNEPTFIRIKILPYCKCKNEFMASICIHICQSLIL